ncbi:unnamed protein product [Closterium sp. NIES-65]|nr:unnamed protein product [Closterium sp. NIES-65]
MCAHISGNPLSALQTAGIKLPPQKLTPRCPVLVSAEVSEMSGVVQETSSEVQLIKKEVAALRADYKDLLAKYDNLSLKLSERVAALEKGRAAANKEGIVGAPGQPDAGSPSKRVDSCPDPALNDTAASPLAGFRVASRLGANQEAAPQQQNVAASREGQYAPASPSPAPAHATAQQPSVPPARDAVYFPHAASRPPAPQRPVAPIQAPPRPPAPIFHQGYFPLPQYPPPPGMPYYWPGAPPQHAPPPQQSYPPLAFPSMSGAGESGVDWPRDSGVEAVGAGAASDALTQGRVKYKYTGVIGGGNAWHAKLLMPTPYNHIRMGPFPSEEEAAKGYKAAALVVRPAGCRIQRSGANGGDSSAGTSRSNDAASKAASSF